MSVARIVQAAIAIADADGLEALSMRRLAGELGAGAMSLYRYVKGRDELIELVIDAVLAEEPFTDPVSGDWRAGLELAARRQWNIYHRHPWILPLVVSIRPSIGPNGLGHMEQALRALDGLGLDRNTMLHVYMVVTSYVQGAATRLASEVEAERRTRVTTEQWWAAQGEGLQRFLASGQYPLLASLDVEGADPAPEAWFEFGLQRLLDGIGTFISARRSTPST